MWVTIFCFHLQEIDQIVCMMVACQRLKKMNIENKDLLDWSGTEGSTNRLDLEPLAFWKSGYYQEVLNCNMWFQREGWLS